MSRREAEIRALQDVIKAYRQPTGVSFDAAWRALWKMQIERHEEMAVIAKTSSVSLVILHLRSRASRSASAIRAGNSRALFIRRIFQVSLIRYIHFVLLHLLTPLAAEEPTAIRGSSMEVTMRTATFRSLTLTTSLAALIATYYSANAKEHYYGYVRVHLFHTHVHHVARVSIPSTASAFVNAAPVHTPETDGLSRDSADCNDGCIDH
jgi:hypothetical protein